MPAPQPFEMIRRATRPVRVGDVTIGGGASISVQSMTTTHTEEVGATLGQIEELAALGCDIVRCAVPNRASVSAFGRVADASALPVVADVHFDHNLALLALQEGAAGVRINPGNMRDREGLREFYRAAAQAAAKVRIGVNSGSIRPRKGLEVEQGDEDLAELMVREALAYCRDAEQEGLRNIVLSLKASDVPTTIAAYRMAAGRCDFPFHLGVTAAGPPARSIVKSAIGIGALLAEGIGDTIRVSMTGPPHDEVKAGVAILEALGLRAPDGPRVISCPTCARCEIDVSALAQEVADRTEGMSEPLTIAVMGCVVNGPGEASEADVGIAGGGDFGYLFREGRMLRKVPAGGLADALVDEVRQICESRRGEGRMGE